MTKQKYRSDVPFSNYCPFVITLAVNLYNFCCQRSKDNLSKGFKDAVLHGELIIGDRQTGKTAVAVDAIINQKDNYRGILYLLTPSELLCMH